jgi:hypothetical protein
MNFTELYQRIKSIEEGAPSEPTAPGGVIKTKNADGSFSYKPKVPGERLSSTLPANQAAKTSDKTDNTKKEPTTANESLEECGDMPMGMMGMSGPQGQQDNLDMNITLHGSGAGGVRNLMNILRDIEGSDNIDVHSHDVSKLFGGDNAIEVAFDEEMGDGGFGSATTHPDTSTAGIDAVTATGNDLASKGTEARKVNGGGNPMHEALTSRLYQMYQAIKEDAGQQDLGDGFMLTSIEAFGGTRPAVLDTQSNTYFILNQREDGSAIARTPAKYLTIKDGKTGASMGGPATNAAFQKAGLIKESGEKKTMSRAAKGYEKYGKKGMQALAKAGKEGKNLDKIRDKYNKYD